MTVDASWSLFEGLISCGIVEGVGGHEAGNTGEAVGCDGETTGALMV